MDSSCRWVYLLFFFSRAAFSSRPSIEVSKSWSGAGSDGTYSQNYQDTWVASLARHNGWPVNASQGHGFFLDLGAFHGTECSNSALLEKSMGWKGICVEPLPVGFENRDCALVSRALSDASDKTVRFFGHDQVKHIGKRSWEDASDDKGRDVKTMTMTELFDCVQGSASKSQDCSGVHGNLPVPSFIHFASLDIEGLEANILKTFPWDRFKVGVWIVEQTDDASRPAHARQEVRDLLKARGYVRAPVDNAGVDEYYVLPEFWHDSLAKKAWRIHPPGSNGC